MIGKGISSRLCKPVSISISPFLSKAFSQIFLLLLNNTKNDLLCPKSGGFFSPSCLFKLPEVCGFTAVKISVLGPNHCFLERLFNPEAISQKKPAVTLAIATSRRCDTDICLSRVSTSHFMLLAH